MRRRSPICRQRFLHTTAGKVSSGLAKAVMMSSLRFGQRWFGPRPENEAAARRSIVAAVRPTSAQQASGGAPSARRQPRPRRRLGGLPGAADAGENIADAGRAGGLPTYDTWRAPRSSAYLPQAHRRSDESLLEIPGIRAKSSFHGNDVHIDTGFSREHQNRPSSGLGQEDTDQCKNRPRIV